MGIRVYHFFASIIICVTLSGCISAEKATFAASDSGKLSEESLRKLNIEPLLIETSDEQRIHALYLPKENAEILTLYLHGNGGNIHNRIAAMNEIASFGSNVLGVSYRGYLNSTGVATEEGVYLDAQAALEYARNSLGYKDENIIVFGRSLGSAVAIDLAQNQNSLGGVILVAPFFNAQKLYESLPMLQRLMVREINEYISTAFRSNEKIPAVKAPTLIIHGTKDSLIPFSHGKELFSLSTARKEFVSIDGADHNDYGYGGAGVFDNVYWRAIEKMLDTTSTQN